MTEPRVAELTITSLGAAGDGIADLDDRPCYVPDSLPGDRVRVLITGKRGDGFSAQLLERLDQGPGRAVPACAHFNDCGGCAAQHMDGESYGQWKRETVRAALGRRGLGDAVVEALEVIPARSRRRATFHILRRRQDAAVGFRERSSHRIVAIRDCPVLAPKLAALFAPLRGLFSDILEAGQRAEALVMDAGGGIDLLVRSPRQPNLAARERLIAFAGDHDLARISWQDRGDDEAELVVLRRAVVAQFGGVAVDLPPGAFLQPSAQGEATLVASVTGAIAGLGPSGRIADLYAGCGALSFPLAQTARVHAVEGAAPMTQAVERAAARAGLAGRVTCETRDLDRRPLTVAELSRFDVVVFDPPRAGAKNQAATLAQSAVPLVVAVSCNPASFARDARILIDGGYVMGPVRPVDQFLWAAHVELTAVFKR